MPPSCQCQSAPSVPKVVSSGLPFDEHLEPARRARRLPRRHPVLGADPDAIRAGRRELDLGGRVRHRHAQPVRQQVRRAHLVHELRIDDPAAALRETLRLDKDDLCGHGRVEICRPELPSG